MDDKSMLYIAGATATIIVGIIAAIINVIINWKSNKASKEQRFIQTISAQRVEWINNIRDLFSEYNKTAFLQAIRLHELATVQASKIEDLKVQVVSLNNHIELFLNPTEIVSKKLLEQQENITSMLIEADPNLNHDNIENSLLTLHYIQQVILKAEWKRVKEENRKGTEITDKRMMKIFQETAGKIDPKEYNLIFKKEFNEK